VFFIFGLWFLILWIMKILMLTPYLPYPLLSGGQIRTYNLLKNLKDKHEITLFALIKQEREKKYVKNLQKFCKKITLLKRTKNPWHFRNIFLAGITPYPFLVTRNWPIDAKKKIKKEIKKEKFDLIHAETFYMMPNIPKTKIPILLAEQTIEYLAFLDFTQKSKNAVLKPFLYFDVLKLLLWEKFYWQKASRLVTMSQEDKQFIKKMIKRQVKIDVVANGVDIDWFKRVKKKLPSRPTVLFVGTFKWMPNIDAVEFLVEKIWPDIKESLPQAQLKIVGFSPTKKIKSYSRDASIIVEGNIDDIRKAYQSTHVLLAPIRSGKGTRYKVLEAMATGTPVVATRLGVEGIDIIPGKHALVADKANDLAQETVRVLKNKSLQKKLAQAGKKLVSEKYNWKVISGELDRVYRELGSSLLSKTSHADFA